MTDNKDFETPQDGSTGQPDAGAEQGHSTGSQDVDARTVSSQEAVSNSGDVPTSNVADDPSTSPTLPLPPELSAAEFEQKVGATADRASEPTPPVPPINTPPADDYPADASEPHPKQHKQQRLVVPVVSALLVGALIGGGTGAGVAVWGMNQSSTDSSTVNSNGSGQVIVNNTSSVTPVTAVAAKASPSVVTISASGSSESGTGSGVVLTRDGYILTNAHVATLDGATAAAKITVTNSQNQILPAKLVGYDANSDLAVLKVSATNLQPATFADSNKVNVGDSVVAIGAPLGLSGSVTDGIVSALHRGITVQSSAVQGGGSGSGGDSNQGNDGSPFEFWGFGNGGDSSQQTQSVYLSVIQTDAAINPGNSGGALLNSQGQVVGINVAIATAGSSGDSSSSSSGSIGVGFAIPASFAKRIANELIENGKASHGLLGATIGDSTSSYAGAAVKSLVNGGAAQQAGLQTGDVITAIDGMTVSNATDLTALIRQQPAKANVTITYARSGSLHRVDATLGTYTGN